MTTNAVTSVSLDPVLLAVGFDRASRTLPAVRASGRFAVNVLRDDGEDVARLFASKAVHHAKFEAVTHRVEHGLPVLDDALSWMACDVHELVEAGDHVLALGLVRAVETLEGEPLVFYGGGWRSLGSTTSSSAY